MIHNIPPEVEDYFIEQYKKSSLQVVPGHWPKMKTKEDVDKWIKGMELIAKSFEDSFGERERRERNEY